MSVRDTYVIKIFDAEAIDASGTEYSDVIDLGAKAVGGNFALQIYVTGAGASVTARYQLRNAADATFVTPTGASDICTNYPGVAAQDYEIFSFNPDAARFMRIGMTETQAAAVAVTAWLAIN